MDYLIISWIKLLFIYLLCYIVILISFKITIVSIKFNFAIYLHEYGFIISLWETKPNAMSSKSNHTIIIELQYYADVNFNWQSPDLKIVQKKIVKYLNDDFDLFFWTYRGRDILASHTSSKPLFRRLNGVWPGSFRRWPSYKFFQRMLWCLQHDF